MSDRVCVTGGFDHIGVFDLDSLECQFRIPTTTHGSPTDNHIVRQIRSSPSSSCGPFVVAVSTWKPPYGVLIYDVETRRKMCFCPNGHTSSVYCLETVWSPQTSTNPIVVSGGYGDGKVVVSDAMTGSMLSRLPLRPSDSKCISSLLHVQMWSTEEIYVGHDSSPVTRWSLARNHFLGSYCARVVNTTEGGASGLSSFPERDILVGCRGRSVELYSREEYSLVASSALSKWAHTCLRIPDSDLVVVSAGPGLLEVFDLRRLRRPVSSLQVADLPVRDMDVVGGMNPRIVAGARKLAVLDCSGSELRVRREIGSEMWVKDQTLYGILVLEENFGMVGFGEFSLEDAMERILFVGEIFGSESCCWVRLILGGGGGVLGGDDDHDGGGFQVWKCLVTVGE